MTKNLWNVPPNLAINDVPDGTPTDAVLCRQFLMSNAAASIFKANSGYLLSGQLGRSYVFAKRLTAFGYLVGNVVGVCAKKQVGRVDARRIITLVANNHALRNGAVVKFVADAVSNVIMVAIAHMTVAANLFGLPFPAFIRLTFGDMLPKGFVEGYSAMLVLMAVDKVMLLAGVTVARNLFAAAAFAEDRARGIIGVHKNLQFLCQAQDAANVAGQLLLGATPVIIAQGGAL